MDCCYPKVAENGDDSGKSDEKSKEIAQKKSKELRDATRYVTSVEQMVPYLEEIGIDCDANGDNDNDEDINGNGALIYEFIEIHEEYVNYIDMSVLNPIVEPWDCLQKDVLVEDEIELSELKLAVFRS